MESFELASSTHQDTEAWRSTALKNLDEQIASETRQHPREKLQAKRDGIANATPDQIAAHLQRRHDEAITRRLDRWADWTEDSVRYRDCSFDSFRITHDKQAVVIGKLRDFAQNLAANIDAGKNLVLAGNCGTGKDHLLFALARHAMVTLGLTTRIRLLTGAQLIAKKCADFQGLACHGVGEILALSDPVLPGEQARFSALAALYQIVDERYRRRWPVWVTVNASCRDEMNAMLSAPVADRLIDDALVLHCDWPSHRKPA